MYTYMLTWYNQRIIIKYMSSIILVFIVYMSRARILHTCTYEGTYIYIEITFGWVNLMQVTNALLPSDIIQAVLSDKYKKHYTCSSTIQRTGIQAYATDVNDITRSTTLPDNIVGCLYNLSAYVFAIVSVFHWTPSYL